ncbi:hypothetical protein [Nocardioides bigeumensis]|uniref:Calcium-binding protein n=1 Tax=Nocardioides bigeumensis TaxID=433657 RepID=A0ABN2YKS1_9ACTN
MKRLWSPAAAAAVLVVATASPAAATVSVSGGTVQSDNNGDTVTPFCQTGNLSASGAAAPGSPCSTLESLTVIGNGGTDTIDLSEVTSAAFPVLTQVTIRADEDLFTQTPAADTVYGSPLGDLIRADTLDTISGGEGSDLLIGGLTSGGGLGDDTIVELQSNGVGSGGPGDDRFVNSLTAGGVDGGSGTDTWEWDFDKGVVGVDATIVVTANGVTFTVDGTTLPTSTMTGFEQLYLTLMRQGTHVFDGSAFPGRQHVRGFASNDTIVGGAFDDTLLGGADQDTLTGNGGVDLLEAGDGDDTVQARDGVADRVDCGAGNDTVVADAVDVVVACEAVQLPPVAVPPAPPAPVAPTTGVVKGPDSVTKPGKGKFKFSSPSAGATFECRLDKKAWKACTSPYTVKTKKLDPGKHKLSVRAVAGGLKDATPSKKTFKVKTG